MTLPPPLADKSDRRGIKGAEDDADDDDDDDGDDDAALLQGESLTTRWMKLGLLLKLLEWKFGLNLGMKFELFELFVKFG